MTKRRTITYMAIAALGAGYLMTAACGGGEKKQTATTEKTVDISTLPQTDQDLIKKASGMFGILPKSIDNPENPLNDAKVELGKMLYHDPRLSKSGFISCNSCHNLASFGVDNLPTSIGHKWQLGGRNAPTVLNAAFHTAQFWDGRAKDVEEQAKGPILNPGEMAHSTEDFTVDVIKSIEAYRTLFASAFPGQEQPLTYANIANAIGAFERTLITTSRFDNYLAGDINALNEQEKKGLQTFMNAGCNACHMTATFGGNMYQKFGVTKNYWEATGSKTKDEGRYQVTKNESDKYFFKVPSLRNVTRTYPYFHDGSVWDLKEAVSIMGELQLGKKLNDEEVNDIVVFLETLTGELPAHAKILPTLPPSAVATARPVMN
jgi:cytochrome c peroxidase